MRSSFLFSSIIPMLVTGCIRPNDTGNPDPNANLVGDSDRPFWNPDTSPISNDIPSSSSQGIMWTPPDEATSFDHYVITLLETNTGKITTHTLNKEETSHTFVGLKSDTEFQMAIQACIDELCEEKIDIAESEDTAATTASNELFFRTAKENWQFPQSNTRADLPIVIPNAASPNVISYENVEVNIDFSISYIDTISGALQMGSIEGIDLLANNIEGILRLETPSEQPIQLGGLDIFPSLSAARAKPVDLDSELSIMLFLSSSKAIGQLTSTDGLLGFDYNGPEMASCYLSLDCSPNTCLLADASEGNLSQINSFQVAWESYQQDNMGASNSAILIVEGKLENQEPSVFLSYFSPTRGEWQLETDENANPKPWLSNVQDVSFFNYDTNKSKIYFYSRDSNEVLLSYWDASETGETSRYDFDDLEAIQHVHNIDFSTEAGPDGDGNIDPMGELLPNSDIQKMGARTIFSVPTTQKQIMLVTILDDVGKPKGISIAHLVNP